VEALPNDAEEEEAVSMEGMGLRRRPREESEREVGAVSVECVEAAVLCCCVEEEPMTVTVLVPLLDSSVLEALLLPLLVPDAEPAPVLLVLSSPLPPLPLLRTPKLRAGSVRALAAGRGS
jgi:hypothetical protein